MRTLLVTYLPSGEQSNTKQLLDAFMASAGPIEFEHLDLTEEIPDVLTKERLAAFAKRNYGSETLNAEEESILERIDGMMAQLIRADHLVLATPMHNFSLPAPVKAWFDSVIQSKRMFRMTPDGRYEGLMKGKQALVLTSTGGSYEGEGAAKDYLHGLARALLEMMGFDVQLVSAQGVNQFADRKAEIISAATLKAAQVARTWYAAAPSTAA